MHRVVREHELHVRLRVVVLCVARLLAVHLRVVRLVPRVLRGKVLRVLLRGKVLRVTPRDDTHLDGVHQHLGGRVLLVALAEVERAVVQRQVVVLLLDLADALRFRRARSPTWSSTTFSSIHSFSFAFRRSMMRGMHPFGFRNSSYA